MVNFFTGKITRKLSKEDKIEVWIHLFLWMKVIMLNFQMD
jgi:hypothetical protein